MRVLALLFALTLPLASAAAGTIVIDDDGGPGVDFTDIQPAIDVASDGDLLLVHPGDYTGFMMPRGLVILGVDASDTSVVHGHVTISGIPGPHRAVLSGLRLLTLSVTNNPGHVVLDNVSLTLSSLSPFVTEPVLRISNSKDVRMYESVVTIRTAGLNPDAVNVTNSRFEIIKSEISGVEGAHSECSDAGDGGSALWVSNTSIIAAFQSAIRGGGGGNTADFCEWGDPQAGDGGDALYIRGQSTAVVAGQPLDGLYEGFRGYGDCFPSCSNDGYDGEGLVVLGSSSVRHSGVTVTSQTVAPNSSVTTPALADPFLERLGTLQAGRLQTFWVYGTPGDTAM